MHIYTIVSLLLATAAVRAVPATGKGIGVMVAPPAGWSSDCQNPRIGTRQFNQELPSLETGCKTADGIPIRSSIRRDDCLANNDGRLGPAKNGRATRTCEKMSLDGDGLSAKIIASCRAQDGSYKANVLNLSTFVQLSSEGRISCK